MPSDTRYLQKRRGRYLVQVWVPKDLREFFPARYVEKYLGTSCEREAKQLRYGAVTEIKERFARMRERRPITEAEILRERVALTRRLQALCFDDLSGDPQLIADLGFEDLQGGDHANDMVDRKGLRRRAEEIIADYGAWPTEESIDKLCDALSGAALDVLERWRKGRPAPPMPETQTVVRGRIGDSKFVEIAETYIEERNRDPDARMTAQTVAQLRATFRLFGDHIGETALADVTYEHATGFLNRIGKLHKHYGRRPGATELSLAQLLQRFPAGEGEGLSNKTLNRHQSAMKTFFRWAKKQRLVKGDNPFADLARPKGRQSKTGYLPFQMSELKLLFQKLSFDKRPEKHTITTDMPWILAIALYSGMRAGEICELDAEDIRQRDGVHYFDIAESKSEAGVRLVPIHSKLVDLGLLDYVKSIGTGPLFPGVAPGGPDRKRGHTLAKRFPQFRRDSGIDRDRVVFHSFRKCFVRELELAKINRDSAAQVIGHERGFTFRVYNPEGVDLAMLSKVVEAVRYDGLKLQV